MLHIQSWTDEKWLEELKESLKRVKPHDHEAIEKLELTSSLDWADDSLTVVEAVLEFEERINVEIPDEALSFTSGELQSLTMQSLIIQFRKYVR